MASKTHKRGGKRYAIGVDFGTLSGRALLVDLSTGDEVASAVREYRSGVMDERLGSDEKKLPPEFALQDPRDYLEVLKHSVPEVLKKAKVKAEDIVGVGTDFTSCTMLPTTESGTPLCLTREWASEPHAWVKLWKHHAAQPESEWIESVGSRRGELFLKAYGGHYSSEWFFSKVLETVRHAPEVYKAADRMIEAGDWIVWQMTGKERRSLSAAGFKAMRVYPNGNGGWTYPSRNFFEALDPRMADVVTEKLSSEAYRPGIAAGGLTVEMAKATGLREGTPVAVGNIDAHVAVPACGVTKPETLVMIMGTSTCHLLVGRSQQFVEGVCGVVQDGVTAGSWGYEAGQASVGDLFAWHVKHGVPKYMEDEAKRNQMSIYAWLEKQAAELKPGQSGLLALDWWNGCRSVLMDSSLSGLLIGATLGTRPHEIYRALIEATAFGTRRVLEAFVTQGIKIKKLVACGGLAKHNALLMQIYADVTGRAIHVAASDQACALGAAMYGALAAGAFKDIHAAAEGMARLESKAYYPDAHRHRVYLQIYSEYLRLHDQFGRGVLDTMKRLRKWRSAL